MTPEKIGRYEVQSLLGQGMMGVVYKTYDPMLGRFAAIKVMRTAGEMDEQLRARFYQEARSAGQLSHPNIISIYDVGEDDGQAFIAMEFVEGEDLKAFINIQAFIPFREKLRFVREVCEGLDFAHDKGVIHRDIKPGNVFITRTGGLKILDFGLARLASSDMTRTGIVMGSPYYMSPEQVKGVKDIDGRSDLFSVGVLLYELLTYVRPFEADSPTSVCFKIVAEAHQPISEVLPGCDPELAQTTNKALAKDLEERYQAGSALVEALLDFENDRLENAQEFLRQDIEKLQERLAIHGQQVRNPPSPNPAEQTLLDPQIADQRLFDPQLSPEGEPPPTAYTENPEDYGSLLVQHAGLIRRLETLGETWAPPVASRPAKKKTSKRKNGAKKEKTAPATPATASEETIVEVAAQQQSPSFRFAEAKVPDPIRQLRAGQIVAINREGVRLSLAAEVRTISSSEILLDLVRPIPESPLREEEQIQVKFWDEDQATYVDTQILRVSGALAQMVTISRPHEGRLLPRPSVWKFYDSLYFSFKVVASNDNQMVGKEVRDCRAHNLTNDGLEFETGLPFERGDKLEIDLELPPTREITTIATVSRSSPVESEGESLNLTALVFRQLDPTAHNTLTLFLNQCRFKETGPARWA